MSARRPYEPVPAPSNLPRFQVILERPREALVGVVGRAEKIRCLRESAQRARQELLEWIEDHGLAGEVHDLSEPTAFNVLFVSGTPEAVRRLEEAPHVVSVSSGEDFQVELPEPSEVGH